MHIRKHARRAAPVAAVFAVAAIALAGFALGAFAARPPDFCSKHPSHPSCQSTSTTTTTAPTVEPGPDCTRVYTQGTLSDFVATLAPGDTGCAFGTFNEGVKVTNGGFTLRGPRLYGYLWLTSSANSITLEDVYLDNRYVSTAWALLVQGDGVTLRRAEVTNGDKAGSQTDGICVLAGFGFEDDPANTAVGFTVENSRIHDCGDDDHEHSIYLESTRNAVVRDNYLYGSGGYGVHMYPDAQGSLIEHNLISDNSRACKANLTFSGESAHPEYKRPHGSSNNKVFWNLITFPACDYNVESWYPRGSLDPVGNEVAFNCVYGAPRANFGELTTASGVPAYVEHDNLIVDPLYVDRAARNYQLLLASPCLGLGPR